MVLEDVGTPSGTPLPVSTAGSSPAGLTGADPQQDKRAKEPGGDAVPGPSPPGMETRYHGDPGEAGGCSAEDAGPGRRGAMSLCAQRLLSSLCTLAAGLLPQTWPRLPPGPPSGPSGVCFSSGAFPRQG